MSVEPGQPHSNPSLPNLERYIGSIVQSALVPFHREPTFDETLRRTHTAHAVLDRVTARHSVRSATAVGMRDAQMAGSRAPATAMTAPPRSSGMTSTR
jgi:hypothetical protein